MGFGSVRNYLAPFYSSTGRLSLDSKLMIGMLLMEYCSGIGRSMGLCEEGDLELARRWFCRVDLTD